MPAAKFTVDAHVLTLLGDELIGNPRLAVFELVKNSYDADAEKVTVTLNLDVPKPKIVVEDDGCGMSYDDLVNGWLRIGTAYKRSLKTPTREFLRRPLGEKGVGRLAVQKLGRKLSLLTRREGESELQLEMNW